MLNIAVYAFRTQCIVYTVHAFMHIGAQNDLDHTSIIRQHYVFLVDNLDAKHSGLVDELYQSGVLSREECDIINSDMISFSQNEKLLSMLSRKTKDQFDMFLDALDKTGQQHVRNQITGRQRQFCCCCIFAAILSVKFLLHTCYGCHYQRFVKLCLAAWRSFQSVCILSFSDTF